MPMLSRALNAFLAAALLGAALPAIAHPHVWIDYAAVAQMRGTTLYALKERWTFSKGFPVPIVGDMTGMPKSGPVGEKYTAVFKQQAFNALKGADYFTQVFANGKPIAVGEAAGFSVTVDQGHVVYDFLVPLVAPVDVKRAKVQLGVWDETFFVDFQGAPAPAITLDAHAPKTCKAQPFEDHEHAIFGGSIFPQASLLIC
jgi:ABC-type uncharacterized transport system substrate-binding protein